LGLKILRGHAARGTLRSSTAAKVEEESPAGSAPLIREDKRGFYPISEFRGNEFGMG
jgi:hypothetical protein